MKISNVYKGFIHVLFRQLSRGISVAKAAKPKQTGILASIVFKEGADPEDAQSLPRGSKLQTG